MEWNDSYVIGVEAIDTQHKKLVHMISRLQSALVCGTVNQEVANGLRFVVDYAREHFRDEERLMQDIGYEELAAHRQQHQRFMSEVAAMLLNLKKGKGIDPYAFIDFLINWLTNHIQRQDQRIGRWLRGKEAAGPPPG